MTKYYSEKLDIGGNYTKGELEVPRNQHNQGLYHLLNYQTIFIFSTIFNDKNWVNYKMDDTHFVYTTDPKALTCNKELLLFIRKDQSTGFYYFGPCIFSKEIIVENYFSPVCILELSCTSFSAVVKKLPNKQKFDLNEIGIY